MTWHTSWQGQPTEFMPEHLAITGKPGRLARAAREAIWEAVQAIAEQDPSTLVVITANGWEDSDKPGLGRISLALEVKDKSVIQDQLDRQRPVDLSRVSSPPPESAHEASPDR